MNHSLHSGTWHAMNHSLHSGTWHAMYYELRTMNFTLQEVKKMLIEVLGTGCSNCNKAYEVVKRVIEAEHVEAEVVKVEDMNVIVGRGVMMTPSICVDGDVKMSGKVPTDAQVKEMIGK
jgi:small redox-active disulfide protein 2